MKNKKAAMELSIGTLVIIVIAMTMLILGIVLVKTIFSGAKYNVDEMNNKVRDEINKLFTEDKKMVVYLPNNLAKVDQGETWGVGFAVKNTARGTSDSGSFSYEVKFASSECVSETEAMTWIKAGKQEDNVPINPGDTEYFLVRFGIPEDAPLCIVRYRINVQKDGESYDSEIVDIEPTS